MGPLKHHRKSVGIELGPDTRDMLRSMKIDMNLAEREGKYWLAHLDLSLLTA